MFLHTGFISTIWDACGTLLVAVWDSCGVLLNICGTLFIVFVILVILLLILLIVNSLYKKFLGIVFLNTNVNAGVISRMPLFFRQLMKPEIVENSIDVFFRYVYLCGDCERPVTNEKFLPAYRTKNLTIEESEKLLKDFISNSYEITEIIRKKCLLSIDIRFSFEFKRIRDINMNTDLLRPLKNSAWEQRIKKIFLNNSARRMGKCCISYSCGGCSFQIFYDGYEYGFKAMLENLPCYSGFEN